MIMSKATHIFDLECGWTNDVSCFISVISSSGGNLGVAGSIPRFSGLSDLVPSPYDLCVGKTLTPR